MFLLLTIIIIIIIIIIIKQLICGQPKGASRPQLAPPVRFSDTVGRSVRSLRSAPGGVARAAGGSADECVRPVGEGSLPGRGLRGGRVYTRGGAHGGTLDWTRK